METIEDVSGKLLSSSRSGSDRLEFDFMLSELAMKSKSCFGHEVKAIEKYDDEFYKLQQNKYCKLLLQAKINQLSNENAEESEQDTPMADIEKSLTNRKFDQTQFEQVKNNIKRRRDEFDVVKSDLKYMEREEAHLLRRLQQNNQSRENTHAPKMKLIMQLPTKLYFLFNNLRSKNRQDLIRSTDGNKINVKIKDMFKFSILLQTSRKLRVTCDPIDVFSSSNLNAVISLLELENLCQEDCDPNRIIEKIISRTNRCCQIHEQVKSLDFSSLGRKFEEQYVEVKAVKEQDIDKGESRHGGNKYHLLLGGRRGEPKSMVVVKSYLVELALTASASRKMLKHLDEHNVQLAQSGTHPAYIIFDENLCPFVVFKTKQKEWRYVQNAMHFTSTDSVHQILRLTIRNLNSFFSAVFNNTKVERRIGALKFTVFRSSDPLDHS